LFELGFQRPLSGFKLVLPQLSEQVALRNSLAFANGEPDQQPGHLERQLSFSRSLGPAGKGTGLEIATRGQNDCLDGTDDFFRGRGFSRATADYAKQRKADYPPQQDNPAVTNPRDTGFHQGELAGLTLKRVARA
jgi:hypothetical protein